MFKKATFSLLAAMAMCAHFAYAGHVGSIELSYRHVSDSTYEFTGVMYSNCQGITAPNTMLIRVLNGTTNAGQFNIGKLPTSGVGIPPLNPPELTACFTGNLCYNEYVYRGTYTMLGRSADWRFYYNTCCYPNDVDNIALGAIHNECGLNNLDIPNGNSSPFWHDRRPVYPGHTTDTVVNFGIQTICEGRNLLLDQSVVEYQNDVIEYELIPPQTGVTTGASHINGYSLNYPLPVDTPPAFDINKFTGIIPMKAKPPATISGNRMYVVAIRAYEYRMVGTVMKRIGYVTRNLTIYTTEDSLCPDQNVTFVNPTNPGVSQSSITLDCDSTSFDVRISAGFLCTSLDSNGTDALVVNSVTGDTIGIKSARVDTCARGSAEMVRLELDSALPAGMYWMMFHKGADGNVLLSECGAEMKAYQDTLTINIPNVGVGVIAGDSISPQVFSPTIQRECGQTELLVNISDDVMCNSIEVAGSDFMLIDSSVSPPVLIPIAGAAPVNCNGNSTRKIIIALSNGLDPGSYRLNLVAGSDGNTLTNACRSTSPTATLKVEVSDVSVDLGADREVCENEPVFEIIDAGLGHHQYQWSTGDTSHLLQATDTGVYFVTVYNAYGCSATDQIHIKGIPCHTGIDEARIEGISIFPNPTSGMLYLRSDHYQGNFTLSVINMMGQEVSSQHVILNPGTATQLDVSHLKKGVYFVQMVTVGNEVLESRKMVLK